MDNFIHNRATSFSLVNNEEVHPYDNMSVNQNVGYRNPIRKLDKSKDTYNLRSRKGTSVSLEDADNDNSLKNCKHCVISLDEI